ncbi:MAG: hypothetical protein AAGH76_08840 [Pseudomonadota bacterium]
MSRNFLFVFFAVKGLLVAWGLLGLVEYFVPAVNVGLQDDNFPRGVQFLHWVLVLLTGSIFLVGFYWRWRFTPFATITMYATLATLCFVETVDFDAFGGGTARFFIMGAEYLLYIVLSTYLIKSTHIQDRFEQTPDGVSQA